MKRLGVVTGVLVVLALALVVYARVGWSRMEAACSVDPPGGPAWRSVGFSWSWSPVGFQCTYDDGRQRSSLWFSSHERHARATEVPYDPMSPIGVTPR